MTQVLLNVEGVSRRFGGERRLLGGAKPSVHAVRDVNLALYEGETLGIVGESGCGKSTLARMLVGLDRPSVGAIRLSEQVKGKQGGNVAISTAATIQYVFQDPVSSLNPRKTIRTILTAPMKHLLGLSPQRREERLKELMQAVNLREEYLERYPHEFSGGQAQRIGIARSLAAQPRLIVFDEPVSALDVSVQAQVLNLLDDLKSKYDLTYVFISHDLSVVEAISDRVAVMYFGSIVELASANEIFSAPRHPYTKLLLESAPVPGRKNAAVEEEPAEPPDPFAPMPGCAFAPRCAYAKETCKVQQPLLEAREGARRVACHFPLRNEKG